MKIFLVFFFLSLIAFICFPLRGSLTGDEDTILNLAIYKTFYNQLMGALGGEAPGSWCYPILHFRQLVSIDLGGAIIFVLIQKIIGSVIWSWWIYVSVIYALNAFGFSMVLSALDIRYIMPRIAGGIFFSFSSYCLGNIDNINFINLAMSLVGIALIIEGVKATRPVLY